MSILMMPTDVEDFGPALDNPILLVYLPTIIFQTLIFVLVFFVARVEGGGLRSLRFDRLTLDKVFLGLAFFIGAGIVLSLLALLIQSLGAAEFRDPTYLLPSSTQGKVVWIVLSMVVAVSEEAAFRGYALTRLRKFLRTRVLTAVVVSIAFSMGHLYQGVGGVIVIFAYGLMFSALFYKTGSIWPGIVAHFLQDALPIFALDMLRDIQG